ncbi:MAG TPA: hypothetical protein VFP34_04820 [Microlunatus sp.]|nr:hypothetical protein [Microlunatus sp.]
MGQHPPIELDAPFWPIAMPLTVALAIAATGGFIAGVLIGRNRYKK